MASWHGGSEGTLRTRVEEYLRSDGGHGPVARLTVLTGDASDRRYVRVHDADGRSMVLAVYAGGIEWETLPFALVSRLLEQLHVPTPAVLGHSNRLGVVALEDLGDVTLQAALDDATADQRRSMYREAVDLIVRLQQEGASHASHASLPYRLSFDIEKLTAELDFFVRHFLEGHAGVALSVAERAALEEEWQALAGELAAEPRVLCHRDYHSRNLMRHAGRLHVIDFQDARLGPDTYDLVSLLRDSYVDIGDQEREALIDHFVEATGTLDAAIFRRRFDVMSVQRQLKALGTFGYQAAVRGNATYLRYVPRTIGDVWGTLGRHARFTRLAAVLGPYLESLAPGPHPAAS